jgi:hypothetical protein
LVFLICFVVVVVVVVVFVVMVVVVVVVVGVWLVVVRRRWCGLGVSERGAERRKEEGATGAGSGDGRTRKQRDDESTHVFKNETHTLSPPSFFLTMKSQNSPVNLYDGTSS